MRLHVLTGVEPTHIVRSPGLTGRLSFSSRRLRGHRDLAARVRKTVSVTRSENHFNDVFAMNKAY